MGIIQLVGLTPEENNKPIFDHIDRKFEELKKQFQPKQPNDYLTRKEVAKLLKVDLSTIHNWCKSGKLKPLGIGNRVYFLRSDIEQSLIPLK